MKAVILAGGLGTRMGSETVDRPKPMIEVGGYPLLWHVMRLCAAQGVTEFIVALGYKGFMIKDYFLRYRTLQHDLSIDLESGELTVHRHECPKWRVHMVDTGLLTMTGGRLKRLAGWLKNESHFLMTYGDGLADVDLCALEKFHLAHGRPATLTAVRVPERFGRLTLDGDTVMEFHEKPEDGRSWVNGGFFVLNPEVLDYIDDDETVWEYEPLQRLSAEGQLMAYRHEGFWSGMDTPGDLIFLESEWRDGQAPWVLDKRKL
jgi:glucose-1-phosphate cytidylyltransferase